MKLAVIIPTYWKNDGSTRAHLEKALNSVADQTHKDYKVFLIGDAYLDSTEFIEVSKIIDSNKIYVENLEVPGERHKYFSYPLWVCGGVAASNTGIRAAIAAGFDYICHLDHDDWYFPNHLKLLSETIELTGTNFVTTRCGSDWPAIASTEYLMKYRPLPCKIFKVTTCVNYKYFNIVFRNMIEECGTVYPSDADLWARINELLINKNEWGYLINESTCGHGPEQTVIHNPTII